MDERDSSLLLEPRSWRDTSRRAIALLVCATTFGLQMTACAPGAVESQEQTEADLASLQARSETFFADARDRQAMLRDGVLLTDQEAMSIDAIHAALLQANPDLDAALAAAAARLATEPITAEAIEAAALEALGHTGDSGALELDDAQIAAILEILPLVGATADEIAAFEATAGGSSNGLPSEQPFWIIVGYVVAFVVIGVVAGVITYYLTRPPAPRCFDTRLVSVAPATVPPAQGQPDGLPAGCSLFQCQHVTRECARGEVPGTNQPGQCTHEVSANFNENGGVVPTPPGVPGMGLTDGIAPLGACIAQCGGTYHLASTRYGCPPTPLHRADVLAQ
jgi:hypothetical protein